MKTIPYTFFKQESIDRRLQARLPANRIRRSDFQAAKLIEKNRPQSLREFDQIPMLARDLCQQVFYIAPFLSEATVVFMGDHDSTSLLLALLGIRGRTPLPSKMLL